MSDGGQKIFRRAALLLRRRLGKEREDKEFDYIVRMKDVHVIVFSMIGMIAMITVACISWYGGNRHYPDSVRKRDTFVDTPDADPDILAMMYIGQAVISLSTLITIILIIQKHMLLLNAKRKEWSGLDYYDIASASSASKRIQLQHAFRDAYSLFRSDLKYELLWEVGLHIVHPVIWTAHAEQNNGVLETETSLFYIGCQIFMFSRMYLVTRIVHRFSTAYKDRFEIINSDKELTRTNFRIKSDLTLKMVFYNHTALSLLVLVITTLVTFGFCIFVVERDTRSATDAIGFGKLENCLWFAYITFTTIGYGDYFPVSVGGRLVAMLIGVAGITIVNIFSGVITNRVVPNREQKYIAEYLSTTEAKQEWHDGAAIVLQTAYREHVRAKKQNQNVDILHERSNVMYKAMKQFRRARSKMEESITPSNDPIIDGKVMAIADIILCVQHELEMQQKELERLQKEIDKKLMDIIFMLENEC
eukprot:PhF_6_TR11021/c0_g1_i1/m.17850/K04945/KCNN4; potassium intermediate/small conductance calcium-activated channel subfamily N member 4